MLNGDATGAFGPQRTFNPLVLGSSPSPVIDLRREAVPLVGLRSAYPPGRNGVARPNKPWYRKDRDAWVCQVNGKTHVLAKGRGGRAAAVKALAELLDAGGSQGGAGATLAVMFDCFLEHVEREQAVATYRWHLRHLRSALAAIGRDMPAADVRPIDVTAWASMPRERKEGGGGPDVSEWSRTTRRGAIVSVKTAFSWAFDQGLLESNPMARLKPPTADSRETAVDPETARIVLATLKGDRMADVLEFMHETGCRPSEAYRLEASHLDFDAGIAVMPGKTTRGTGKPRVIYLTERAAEVARAAAERNPIGPVFRNRLGNPWEPSAVGSRLGRLRKRHGWPADVTPDGFRHGWVTEALTRGVPDKIVAELAGHQTTAMIHKHYAHLARRAKELRAHAESVRR